MGANKHGSASDNRSSPVAVLIILFVTGRVTLLSLEMLILTWRSGRFCPLIRPFCASLAHHNVLRLKSSTTKARH